jgi:hypothetical protein
MNEAMLDVLRRRRKLAEQLVLTETKPWQVHAVPACCARCRRSRAIEPKVTIEPKVHLLTLGMRLNGV